MMVTAAPNFHFNNTISFVASTLSRHFVERTPILNFKSTRKEKSYNSGVHIDKTSMELFGSPTNIGTDGSILSKKR